MIRHAILLTASIGGLAQAMPLPPLGGALVNRPGMAQRLATSLTPAIGGAVKLAPIAVATGSDVTAAMRTLDETVGVVVIHALGSAKE